MDIADKFTDFLIKNNFLFTDHHIDVQKYLEYFFKDRAYVFRLPFNVKGQEFVDRFRDNIYQTSTMVANNEITTTSIFQISKEEHLVVGYSMFEDEIALNLGMYLKDPKRVPFWLECLRPMKCEEKKKLGFAGFHG